MSVIRKKPYIEALLASMTAENLKSLRTVLNTGGNNVSLDFAHLNAATYKNKVTPVYFKFEDNGLKTGILIWTNTMCALICYHRFQDLIVFELSPTYHTSKKINEYCDINELRRVLDDTVESTGAIDSGSANANTVPVADGEGGVQWKDASNAIKGSNVEEGNAIYLLGVDSNGDVIKDELPEGIVVDESLDTSSTNAIANKPVAEAIDYLNDMIGSDYDSTSTYNIGDIVIYNSVLYKCKANSVTSAWDATKWDVIEIANELETLDNTKANKDGNYPTMTVGMADNLTPYDESAGDDQDDPFLFQATGTANGTQSDFATGSSALMKEKQGNTVVVNQLAKVIDNYNWTANNGNLITNDGVGTFTASAQNGSARTYIDLILGHNYLIAAKVKLTTANNDCVVAAYDGSLHTFAIASSTNYQYIIGKFTAANSGTGQIQIRDQRASDWDAIEYKEVICIDLTQWFNGNIPQDLLDNPENFFRYYQGSLAYNAGQLVNANSRYIKCIGRQQWDEETEISGIVGGTLNSKNFIDVIPNATYYLKSPYACGIVYYDNNQQEIRRGIASANSTFITPSNCIYIKFYCSSDYGTTYNNDITISLYYEGESGYDDYYAYEVLTNNDTGTETLLSAGSVKDIKTPDGTIIRKVGTYTFTGNETIYGGTSGQFNTPIFEGIIKPPASNDTAPKNIMMIGLDPHRYNGYGDYDLGIYVNQSGDIFFQVSSVTTNTEAKAYLTGKTIYYELATPTTETGTPYSANLVIDDFGSMEFAGTSGVPQGNLIFYPVDYKAFVDTLYDYTEGTPSDLVKQSDLVGYEKVVNKSSDITMGSGVTASVKIAYKIGNIVILTITARNTSGSSIASGTTIATLGSGLYANNVVCRSDVGGNDVRCVISNSGNITLGDSFADDAVVYINVSYAVA